MHPGTHRRGRGQTAVRFLAILHDEVLARRAEIGDFASPSRLTCLHRLETQDRHAVDAPPDVPARPAHGGHDRAGLRARDIHPHDRLADRYHIAAVLYVPDGSQFTSGAACNPTLTIVARAIRQMEHIAGRMARRSLTGEV